MRNNLMKIVGTLALLSIPLNINQDLVIKKEYNLKIEYPKITKNEYIEKTREINDRLNTLNIKREFLSERLKQGDILYELKGKYTKQLIITEKEISKNQHKKDSIYRLYSRK